MSNDLRPTFEPLHWMFHRTVRGDAMRRFEIAVDLNVQVCVDASHLVQRIDILGKPNGRGLQSEHMIVTRMAQSQR